MTAKAKKKGCPCPHTVRALTRALEKAKRKEKVDAAKKKAAKKALAALKKRAEKKKTRATVSAFERASQKYKAVWS